jgi:hypothetical protein
MVTRRVVTVDTVAEAALPRRERAMLTRMRRNAAAPEQRRRWLAVRRPDCPADVLDLLVDDPMEWLVRTALVHPNLSEISFVRVWRESSGRSAVRPWRLVTLMMNPSAPVRYVNTRFDRARRLAHPRCDAAELVRVAREGLVAERRLVAQNPALPVEAQQALMVDAVLAVRKQLAVNATVVPEVVGAWARVERSPVVLRALVRLPAGRAWSTAVADRLVEVESRGRMTRVVVAQHSESVAVIAAMARDTDPWVAQTAAGNPHLDDDGMLAASMHRSAWVRHRVTGREDCPEDARVAAALMGPDPWR